MGSTGRSGSRRGVQTGQRQLTAQVAGTTARRRRADIFDRQIEREGAAAAGHAAQMNFAAEEVGEFAADGEPKPSTAILAAGAGIGLLERFKDDLLLLERNADAGVGHFEGDHGRRLAENRMFRRSSRQLRPTRPGAHRHAR